MALDFQRNLERTEIGKTYFSWLKISKTFLIKSLLKPIQINNMKNKINHDANPSYSSRSMGFFIAASILALAFISGCNSTPYNNTPGDVQENTQLAISPNGNRLLVSWNDSSGKLHARLAELHGTAVTSERDLVLPQETLTTSFGNSNEHVLITTWDKKSSSLFKFDLNQNIPELIYQSQFLMRFPLETSPENYVFLEGNDPENRTNQWRRFQHGQKTLLNPKNYGMASTMNVVGDSIFILEPWSPPAFRNIYGTLPAGLSSLVVKDTFNIKCADRNPLTCLRQKIHLADGGSSYFGTMELINGLQRCDIHGQWIDPREIQISRDGSTVVFHAAISKLRGPRAIYIVKNKNLICPINAIEVKVK